MIFICDNFLAINEKQKEGTRDEGTRKERKQEQEQEEEEEEGITNAEQQREEERIRRFLKIVIQLPMELQMLLINRTQRSSSDLISLSDREIAFKSLAFN